MTQIDVSCSQCGSGEYQLLDASTGEVVCPYCRNKWIVPELRQKSETERFLEEQAKQPRVIVDNTTETDKQLMDMISRFAFANPLRAVSNFIRRVFFVAVVIIVLVIVLMLLNVFGVLSMFR